MLIVLALILTFLGWASPIWIPMLFIWFAGRCFRRPTIDNRIVIEHGEYFDGGPLIDVTPNKTGRWGMR
jgi:hypothetical protein